MQTVVILNPDDFKQIVNIYCGQDVLLYLDICVFGDLTLLSSTDNLKINLEEERTTDSQKVYRISHCKKAYEWSKYSSVILGDIWINGQKKISKIQILLESKNKSKSKIKTIINPENCIIVEMYPHNILEVILYDERFGYYDDWKFDCISIPNLGIEEIGHESLCLNPLYMGVLLHENNLYSMFPRSEAINGMLTNQHHFWFRFNPEIIKFIEDKNDVYHVGNVLFEGVSSKFDAKKIVTQKNLSLYVDCRKKNYKKIKQTLKAKKSFDYNENDFKNIAMISRSEVFTKKTLPQIRDVDIKLLENDFVDCQKMLAVNENYVKQKIDDFHIVDYEDFDFNVTTDYRKLGRLAWP